MMTKLSALLLVFTLPFTYTQISNAFPVDTFVESITQHVVKVQVFLQNGAYGMGSGVVISEDQVVTNCHVVANAQSISINTQGENFAATALKADWHHDVCILKVAGLKAPVATIASSDVLQYEQAVYTAGFANNSPRANSTSGTVKGLYPMDDSVIVRASNAFRMGDSGGGLFDENGHLVGIVTVKSPGRNAFYYHMSVKWVQALMAEPEHSIVIESSLPFWAEAEHQWPFFMRVVHPLKTENWQALSIIATQWLAQEPNTLEALFYQAVAEFSLNQMQYAEAKFNQVLVANSQHTSTLYYLGVIAEKNGKHTEALNMLAMLDAIDATTAQDLKVVIGLASNSHVD
jgi:serine protease Do